MAFGGGSSIGTGATSAAATSTTITTSSTVSAGGLIVVRVAKDNTSTTDGVTNEVTSVTDSAGNTYTKGGEYTTGQGSAKAGATVAVFYGKLTSQLASGGTITINHDSQTDVAVSANAYTMGSGTIAQGGSTQTLAVTAGSPGSMSLSGLTSREYLFLRAVAEEEEAGSATTPSSGYTASDVVVSTTAGSATSNITLRGEARILTGTGSTSDPSGDVADHASVFLALYEVSATDSPGSLIGGGLTNAKLISGRLAL